MHRPGVTDRHRGATTLNNLVLLCRLHHVLWHLGKISLRDLPIPWHPDATSTGPPRE
jgi:predicted restriction endonuclease